MLQRLKVNVVPFALYAASAFSMRRRSVMMFEKHVTRHDNHLLPSVSISR
jgi:hypothetical protein